MARPRRNAAEAVAQVMADDGFAPPAAAEPDPVPARSPARQRLAEAIATVAALEAEVAEHNAAASAAEEQRNAARRALHEAERTLERSRPRPVDPYARQRDPYSFSTQEAFDAYQAEQNAPPAPPVPIGEAKAAVEAAKDALDSAEALVQHHQRLGRQAADRLGWSRGSIRDAARLAVHYDPAMAALATETKALVTRAAAAVEAFGAATGGALLQYDHPYHGSTRATDLRADPDGWAYLLRWRAALDELQRDPDAPLPMP